MKGLRKWLRRGKDKESKVKDTFHLRRTQIRIKGQRGERLYSKICGHLLFYCILLI